MSTPLTIAEVERIAALAQLELSDDEKRTFASSVPFTTASTMTVGIRCPEFVGPPSRRPWT